MQLRRSLAAGALALAIVSAPVLAHHGFSGRYDISQPLWIEGVVEEAYFGQPHPTLRVRTAADLTPPAEIDLSGAIGGLEASDLALRDDILGTVVEVQFPPLGAFFRFDDRVSEGSRVAIVALRNCEEPHQLRGQWMRAEAGEPGMRGRATSYMVQGC